MLESSEGLLRRAVGGAKRLKRRAKQRLELFDALQIVPFRSYGTRTRLVVRGRLIERDGAIHDSDSASSADDVTQEGNSTLANLRAAIKRLRSDEIPDARLEVRFGRQVLETATDEEGYFRAQLELDAPVAPGWQAVELKLLSSMAGSEGIRATAQVLVPPGDAEFGVISDVDDTVLKTGSAQRLRMIHTVLFKNAQTREPFPGVADFYRALSAGSDRKRSNPLFYVSRSGWNLYDLFDAFFELHRLPRGPLFLTDLSVVEPRSTQLGPGEDKLSRIRKILETYPSLPFLLIGDSGQQDPEVYRTIVQEHPGRIRAVYIRDVADGARDREVARLLEEIRAAGTPALAVQDTAQASAHAAEQGFIARH